VITSLLFALTVTSAMLIMEGMARLPVKRFYRYLFGWLGQTFTSSGAHSQRRFAYKRRGE
jgi:hypothetical protein